MVKGKEAFTRIFRKLLLDSLNVEVLSLVWVFVLSMQNLQFLRSFIKSERATGPSFFSNALLH